MSNGTAVLPQLWPNKDVEAWFEMTMRSDRGRELTLVTNVIYSGIFEDRIYKLWKRK